MQFLKCRIILVLLAVSGCFSSGQTQSGSGTGIEGVIMFGPTQGGPIRPDVPGSKPLANAMFVVENEKRAVASFTTDDQGRFRISLAPEHYTVSMNAKKHSIGYYRPSDVDVDASRQAKVHWERDA